MSRTLFSHKAEAVIQETDFRLSNMDFSVKQGELVGIIGKVGSGKSSLLTSILGKVVVYFFSLLSRFQFCPLFSYKVHIF